MTKVTTEDFIKKAELVHKGKYDYSKTIYTGNKFKITIICPEHGEFTQIAGNHLKGCGCQKCGKNYRKTTEEYVAILKEKFPDTNINFDKVVYKNQSSKITLVCPEHGEFTKTALYALDSVECPECQKKRLHLMFAKTTEQFIEDAHTKHGDKYDYSKVEYEKGTEKVCIICPEHGEFWQTPLKHLRGAGCPKCGDAHMWTNRPDDRVTTEKIIERFKVVHGDTYDYSMVNFKTCHDKVSIICKTHGMFYQHPMSHLRGAGCPVCYNERSTSDAEKTFCDFIASVYTGEIRNNDRTVIHPKEIDIYLPKAHIGFEYNGLYWHSSKKLHNNLYHKLKTDSCKENGITLYHIYEDEWLLKPDAVKSFVSRVLSVPMKNIDANECEFKEVQETEAFGFLQENALTGNFDYNKYYALANENSIQALVLVNEAENSVEIVSIYQRNGVNVKGVLNSVVSEIKRLHPHKTVNLMVDKRLDSSERYLNKGFVLCETVSPEYSYIVRDFRIPKGNVEEYLNNDERVLKIYDCGYDRLQLVD